MYNFKIKLSNNAQKPIIQKPIIIIILRGHVRDSFDNNKIYEYILYLSNIYKLYIFIHTWNIKSNDISWKNIKKNNSIINEDIITNYFKNINIQKIIIDDENDVDLIGNVTGIIKTTLMPIKGWKYMWYGIYKINNYILNNINKYNLNENTYALNIRFDYFTNCTINQYNLDYLNRLYNFNTNDIQFMKNIAHIDTMFGIDNIYFGKFYKIYYTAKLFHSNLDYIIECFKDIYSQEGLVYILQKYINIYSDDYLYDNDYINLTIKTILTKLRIDYIKSKNKQLTSLLNIKDLSYNFIIL
jgi:hypothetical protein